VTGTNSLHNLGAGSNAPIQSGRRSKSKVAACSGAGNNPSEASALSNDRNLFVVGSFRSGYGNPFGFSVASPVATWAKVPDANIAGLVPGIVCVLHDFNSASAYAVAEAGDLCVTGHNGVGHKTPANVWTKVEAVGLAGSVRPVSGGYFSGTSFGR
jgi:hypothetical protein